MKRAALAVLAVACAAGALLAHRGEATAAPTYYRDVAPILDAKCSSCHRLGGIAPFSLTTAGAARAHAPGIVRMTKAGLMPPWMPGPDSADLVGRDRRRLTPAELSTLAAWAAAGAADRLGQPPWIAAWVPGHTTNSLPAGTGVLLHKGAKIIMQVHYNLIESAGPDRSRARLRLRPATTKLTTLQTHLIAAPVELPCPAGVTGPQCSRKTAFQDEIAKYGVENAYIPTALLQLCGKTLADYPQQVGSGTSIGTSCDRAVTAPETIYGVAGHMHLRGRDIRITLDPGTAKQQTLLHIPAWDFHWQDVYYLVHPLAVGPGDTIRVSCTFDNSKADQPVVGTKQLTPRYVLWGEGTSDEMCLGMLSVAAG